MSFFNLQAEQENEKESSDFIRKRVTAARQRQYDRYGEQICNGRVSYDQLTKSNITIKQPAPNDSPAVLKEPLKQPSTD